MIGIAVWARDNPMQRAKEFAQKHKLTFPVLVDETKEGKTAKAYGIIGVPTNVVIGKDGKIRYLQAGFDLQGIKEAIEAALRE